MGDVAIRVDRLGKRYDETQRRGLFDLRDRVSEFFRNSLSVGQNGRGPNRVQPVLANKRGWALKDICLEIRPGDVVGVMGRNGSGKTTFMKIVARITEPTEGAATIHGRVGTMLDVGAGLHGELSGRENIFLNAAVHGMQRDEIRRRLDEIIDFSELESSIDQPLKYFSSGMCLRLAFTVASFLRSDVLLVDEVLAQADPRFQSKCLKKMSVLASEGCAVLIVSHDFECLREVCTRGLVFSGGHVVHDGPVNGMVRTVSSPTTPAGYAEEILGPVRLEPKQAVETWNPR